MGRFDPTLLGYLGFLAVPGWLFPQLEALRIFGLFFLFLAWPALGSLRHDRETDDPTAWIDIGGRNYLLRYYVSSLLSLTNPFFWFFLMSQLLGQCVVVLRNLGRLPAVVDRPNAPSYRLPFSGTWTVLNGGTEREHSHSWGVFAQRYAYDFVVTDEEGSTHEGDGSRLADYYCWNRRIMAPAAGVVIAAKNSHRDNPRPGGWLDIFQRDPRGNFVTIDHGGEYSVLAHLREGSVTVRPGDRVSAGEVIGRCGNSGNSTEPHLHFHVQDRPHFVLGMGLPVPVVGVAVDTNTDPLTTTIRAGQQVRPADEP